ncbi:hypothetical protein [Xanthobacter pseudotagetidis]|uniref:hypothetical protein n=1 Tax=Xanthobacter pseudotagetidis TaxID=3119911 RepID=UPI00372A2D73
MILRARRGGGRAGQLKGQKAAAAENERAGRNREKAPEGGQSDALGARQSGARAGHAWPRRGIRMRGTGHRAMRDTPLHALEA